MLASLFILDSISGISLDKKVPASVFKKNDLRDNPLFLSLSHLVHVKKNSSHFLYTITT